MAFSNSMLAPNFITNLSSEALVKPASTTKHSSSHHHQINLKKPCVLHSPSAATSLSSFFFKKKKQWPQCILVWPPRFGNCLHCNILSFLFHFVSDKQRSQGQGNLEKELEERLSIVALRRYTKKV